MPKTTKFYETQYSVDGVRWMKAHIDGLSQSQEKSRAVAVAKDMSSKGCMTRVLSVVRTSEVIHEFPKTGNCETVFAIKGVGVIR